MAEVAGEVARLVAHACQAGWIPGASAAWSVAGKAGELACGRATLRPLPAAATPDTRYDLASLTKPLVTTTLLLLARRARQIDLDWPVERVLPETRRSPVADLTVAQLATHTAGLPAWMPVYTAAAEQGRTALEVLISEPPERPPGLEVVYSCLGFLLLGIMLERVSDRSLDELFRDQVTRPCGCQTELCFRPAAPDGPVAAGAATPAVERRLVVERGGDPDTVPADDDLLPDDGNARFLGGVAGNAGLFGTARGVATIARHYLPTGASYDLLTREEVDLAVSNHTPAGAQARGLGWQLAATPGSSAGSALAANAFGHTGFTGTSLWVDPGRVAITVLLTNRHHPSHRGIDLHPLRRRFHAIAIG